MPELMVRKRDGRLVPFDQSRIERAVERCYAECANVPTLSVKDAADQVGLSLGPAVRRQHMGGPAISVEEIQDLVEETLIRNNSVEAAKRYILYRAEHDKLRADRPVPPEVARAYAADAEFFPTPLQRFQFVDKYARFNPELGRRETWVETVDRAVDFLHELASPRFDLGAETYERIRRGILEMKVMPSMRLLAMAGAAGRRNNACLYNCTYLAVHDIRAFTEALLLSMSGCGVGFSVESQFTDKLPPIEAQHAGQHGKLTTHTVEDSTEGWAEALSVGLNHWFFGCDVLFDYSAIRPAGTPLRIKGGRASGPDPLRSMLAFVRDRILARQGSRLRPIDVHDIMCAIGQGVVSGGVRRTAMISLFDADDQLMLHAKDAGFERENPQRWNANNSMVWTSTATMDQATFIERFLALVRGGTGEPGIFSRDAARKMMPERRDPSFEFGTNPCGEIILRDMQMCNLSAAIVRADDDYNTLAEKVELASVIGTIQSLATHFPGLRPDWKKNCEEERLLGVDITGQQDHPAILDGSSFTALRAEAVRTNRIYANKLGINRSAAVTCVKPSGNTSQLVDCASGLHARWAPYYVRNVRVSATSPVARLLKDAGAPMSPENGDDPENPRTWVVSFPVAAPDGAVTRNDRSAVEQCEWWLKNKMFWTEHNPSVTITYKPDEVLALMAWVWGHRDVLGGMAFLPSFDAQYDQLPYIEISREEYERRIDEFPTIDWSKLYRLESTDQSNASTTLACEGDRCLIE